MAGSRAPGSPETRRCGARDRAGGSIGLQRGDQLKIEPIGPRGLRYLEQGDYRLVFEALHERRILLNIAPHLVRPLPFVFPVHQGDRVPFWKLTAGVGLYALLALFRNVGSIRILGKRALLAAEPALRERGLVGATRYYDAQCDDARLVLATIRSAMRHGARVANYMEVDALEKAGGVVHGAKVRDVLNGETGTIQAKVVVNATGPWSDLLRRLEDPNAKPLLRITKGAHVMVPRSRIGHESAITMTSPIDGRVMFALPWGEFSYIGTTDTDTAESGDRVARLRGGRGLPPPFGQCLFPQRSPYRIRRRVVLGRTPPHGRSHIGDGSVGSSPRTPDHPRPGREC